MSNRRIVAIHQPNFFPWLGYFNKLARADVFLVMDNVQLSKKGGTWSNRVRLLLNGQAAWTTMPIVRSYSGPRDIKDIKIDQSKIWQAKLLKTIEANYRRAPFFEVVFPLISSLLNNPTDCLTTYNLSAITALSTTLGLDTSKLVIGSTLAVHESGTDLLISMVKAVDGTAYLCGGGAEGYQEDDKFGRQGIELIYQHFRHPEYPQVNTSAFIPGLSIIDVLMNCGFERTRELIVGS
jgi:hypothetical protein